ncbi:LacI family DNA-binding transcriptional regulator [Bacillus sp. NP157]|nr:LacI family DNA-binding transcriptional regulator [Bacillus sp. NP157]
MSRTLPNPPGATRAQPSSTAVARLAGVSQSTVSRVFSASGAAVSPAVREKVMKAAAELNYRPNALPAILQTGRSGIVAVVVGGFYNPFFTEFLRCVTEVLRAHRLEIMLVDTHSDDNLNEIVGELSRYRIDGVISAMAIGSARVARTLESAGIPIVAVNSKRVGTLRTVSTDNRSAGGVAADLLVDGGCRKIAYLAGRESQSQTEREKGFLKRLQSRGMPVPDRLVAGFSYEEGYAAAKALLSSGSRPDGIFCVNDLVAIGAMDALRIEYGLSVPGDIQVIGFDDIPMAGWRAYDVTTFHQDMQALAEGSVALLADEPVKPSITIPPRLVLRGTTRPPR